MAALRDAMAAAEAAAAVAAADDGHSLARRLVAAAGLSDRLDCESGARVLGRADGACDVAPPTACFVTRRGIPVGVFDADPASGPDCATDGDGHRVSSDNSNGDSDGIAIRMHRHLLAIRSFYGQRHVCGIFWRPGQWAVVRLSDDDASPACPSSICMLDSADQRTAPMLAAALCGMTEPAQLDARMLIGADDGGSGDRDDGRRPRPCGRDCSSHRRHRRRLALLRPGSASPESRAWLDGPTAEMARGLVARRNVPDAGDVVLLGSMRGIAQDAVWLAAIGSALCVVRFATLVGPAGEEALRSEARLWHRVWGCASVRLARLSGEPALLMPYAPSLCDGPPTDSWAAREAARGAVARLAQRGYMHCRLRWRHIGLLRRAAAANRAARDGRWRPSLDDSEAIIIGTAGLVPAADVAAAERAMLEHLHAASCSPRRSVALCLSPCVPRSRAADAADALQTAAQPQQPQPGSLRPSEQPARESRPALRPVAQATSAALEAFGGLDLAASLRPATSLYDRLRATGPAPAHCDRPLRAVEQALLASRAAHGGESLAATLRPSRSFRDKLLRTAHVASTTPVDDDAAAAACPPSRLQRAQFEAAAHWAGQSLDDLASETAARARACAKRPSTADRSTAAAMPGADVASRAPSNRLARLQTEAWAAFDGCAPRAAVVRHPAARPPDARRHRARAGRIGLDSTMASSVRKRSRLCDRTAAQVPRTPALH